MSATKKTKPKPAPKKATETTWTDLPRKERNLLLKNYRRLALSWEAEAHAHRESAATHTAFKGDANHRRWATDERACARDADAEAARVAALADLIERNI